MIPAERSQSNFDAPRSMTFADFPRNAAACFRVIRAEEVEEEDAVGFRKAEERFQELESRQVRPVQVVDSQDDRPDLGSFDQQFPQALEDELFGRFAFDAAETFR